MACLQRAGTVLLKPEWENLLDTGGAIKERRTALPAPNKELQQNQKQRLDRKSPIQVRIRFPPAVIRDEPVPPSAAHMGKLEGKVALVTKPRSSEFPPPWAFCERALPK
jgi:hypothetical protein